MKKFWNWLSDILSGKGVKLSVDTILLVATSYLMIKKFNDCSLSNFLRANGFTEDGVKGIIFILIAILVITLVTKILISIFENFPPIKNTSIEPNEISDCLFNVNSEIVNHIRLVRGSATFDLKEVCNQHGMTVNLSLIVRAMANHIGKSINRLSSQNKDVFISLYSYNATGNVLEYMLHYDSKRDLVQSKTIKVNDEKFKNYECVKCLISQDSTAYVLSGSNYHKGASKRHKTIKHYIGCKLISDQEICGFLNIELHNKDYFLDEESMQNFMEEHIFPFKMLLEYQFLKKTFFGGLRTFKTEGGHTT